MKRFVSVWLPAFAIERMRRTEPSALPSDEAGGPPFALVATEERGQVLTALDAAARRAGLSPGMTLADARTILPGLSTRPAAPARDRRALLRLARWASRYGPARNLDGADGFWIDVTGVAHLFLPAATPNSAGRVCGGSAFPGSPSPSPAPAAAPSSPGAETAHTAPATEPPSSSPLPAAAPPPTALPSSHGDRDGWNREAETAMLADLARRLAGFGLTARIALADTRDAAHALARFGRTGPTGCLIAAPGATERALCRLPVEALQISPDAATLLRRLGLKRIGQLTGLPRPALASRFREAAPTRHRGASSKPQSKPPPRSGLRTPTGSLALAGAVLDRLDLALGRTPAPARALAEPTDFSARRICLEPLISTEGLEAAVADLIATLCTTLGSAGCATRRLALTLTRTDGTHATFTAGLSNPSCDHNHLAFLLLPKLAGFDAGFGVDALVLEAHAVERRAAEQAALAAHRGLACAAGPAPLDRLTDRLANRLGAGAVQRFVACRSHIPERAERRRSALAPFHPDTTPPDQLPRPPHLPSRPPLLLAPPEPITVLAEIPEGAPARFTWRRLTCRVVKAEGPERIAPEWWRRAETDAASRGHPASARPRDYYTVEDEHGARYWLFRDGLYGTFGDEDDDEGADARPPTWFLHGLGP